MSCRHTTSLGVASSGQFQTLDGAGVIWSAGTAPYGVSTGDFNVDGNPDLAVANHGSGTVSILLGHGDGTFQSQVSYPMASGAQSVAIGDFNEGGKLDLAAARSRTPPMTRSGGRRPAPGGSC